MKLAGMTLVDRYFLRELVGSGGMADVYLAWDKLRSTKMAIKILRSDLAGDSNFFRNFAKEAELLRKLEHPNIVRVYEFEREDDIVFIVMDWVEGTNLRRALDLRGNRPYSLSEVSKIITPVTSALHYAHQMGVFHCDVKPANILLHKDGRVLISDFGVAQMINERVGGGTPPYMAPEQFLGQPIDSRTDIYALGVTVFELLSGGKLPFTGKSPNAKGTTTKERIGWEHINLPVPSLRELNPDIPEAIQTVIATALQKVSSSRFSSMVEFREAFEQASIHKQSKASQNIRSSGEALLVNDRSNSPPTSSKVKNIRRTETTFFISSGAEKQSPAPETSQTNKLLLKYPEPSTKGIFLFAQSGEFEGQLIPIPLGELTIGRGRQNFIKLADHTVSRRHITLLRTRKGVYIRDEGSTFGTYINGQRIVSGVAILLNTGDIIQIGNGQVFMFYSRS